jgi:hypothetical protein
MAWQSESCLPAAASWADQPRARARAHARKISSQPGPAGGPPYRKARPTCCLGSELRCSVPPPPPPRLPVGDGMMCASMCDEEQRSYSELRHFVIDRCKLKSAVLDCLLENEFDVETLRLCEEADLTEIGLKKGPRVKLLRYAADAGAGRAPSAVAFPAPPANSRPSGHPSPREGPAVTFATRGEGSGAARGGDTLLPNEAASLQPSWQAVLPTLSSSARATALCEGVVIAAARDSASAGVHSVGVQGLAFPGTAAEMADALDRAEEWSTRQRTEGAAQSLATPAHSAGEATGSAAAAAAAAAAGNGTTTALSGAGSWPQIEKPQVTFGRSKASYQPSATTAASASASASAVTEVAEGGDTEDEEDEEDERLKAARTEEKQAAAKVAAEARAATCGSQFNRLNWAAVISIHMTDD